MTPEVQAFASGFLVTLLHAVVSLAILFAAVAIYAVLSPHKEVEQVRAGNGAAAIALGGVILSIAAPLAACRSPHRRRFWRSACGEWPRARCNSFSSASSTSS